MVEQSSRRDLDTRTPFLYANQNIFVDDMQTLLAHRWWRMFPKLSGGLTELLVGGSYRGVSLDAEIFRKPSQPLAARGRTTAEARVTVAAQRDTRLCMHTAVRGQTHSVDENRTP